MHEQVRIFEPIGVPAALARVEEMSLNISIEETGDMTDCIRYSCVAPYNAIPTLRRGVSHRVRVLLARKPLGDVTMEHANTQFVARESNTRPHGRASSPTGAYLKTWGLQASAIEDAADAVIALDGDSRVIAWNSAAAQLYGLDASAVLGRPLSDAITAERSPGADGVARNTPPKSVGLLDGPATHRTRAGREIPVRVSVFNGGSPGAGWRLAFIHDNTEHVRLTQSLDERLKFELQIAELSARFSGLTEDQIDGEIQVWLRRLVEAIGVDCSSFAEALPKRGFRITHTYAPSEIKAYPVGLAQASPWLMQQFAAGRPVVLSRIPDDLPEEATTEWRSFVEAGMKSVIAIPIFIAGSLVCVLTFSAFRAFRDWPREMIAGLHLAGDLFANAIVRRQAKQRLEQQQNELAHVARVAAVGELASVIAHELDQPLTAIVSNAEAAQFLLQGNSPNLDEANDALKDVVDSAMRAAEIVKRERCLLRKAPLNLEPVDLNEAVRDVELFIRAEAGQAAVKVVLDLLPGLPLVTGDRVQLQQVILNVARNGVQAMRNESERRELSIRTESGGAEVSVTISDAGPAVDEALLERMFEPFYTTKTNGLGMGLAISRSILDAHHGRIWAVRNPGRGISVHIAIPRK